MKHLQSALAGGVFQLVPTSGEAGSRRRRGQRRQGIEAEHRAKVYRGLNYRLSMDGLSEAAQEALQREADAWAQAGPDFTHYRSKSLFGPPVPHGLSLSQVIQLRYEFNRLARRLWDQRAEGTQGTITPATRRVFEALLYLASRFERLFPSYERIARLASCGRSSVAVALALLERFGFLTRQRRLKMVEGALGRKAEQDTNGYQLHMPRGLGALLRSLFVPKSGSENQPATATEVFSYLKAHPETWGSPCFGNEAAAYGDG